MWHSLRNIEYVCKILWKHFRAILWIYSNAFRHSKVAVLFAIILVWPDSKLCLINYTFGSFASFRIQRKKINFEARLIPVHTIYRYLYPSFSLLTKLRYFKWIRKFSIFFEPSRHLSLLVDDSLGLRIGSLLFIPWIFTRGLAAASIWVLSTNTVITNLPAKRASKSPLFYGGSLVLQWTSTGWWRSVQIKLSLGDKSNSIIPSSAI